MEVVLESKFTDYSAAVYRNWSEYYLQQWENVDHRLDDLPLMSSGQLLVALYAGYFAMVFFGPKLMEKRAPLNMKAFLISYNFFVILLNIYIVVQLFIGVTRRKYRWYCDVPDTSVTDPEEMRIVHAIYLYSVSKFIEWIDTFCFIVRKKNNQLTFLHVYHHSTMAAFCWVATRWMASGSTFFPMFINSIVHVIMYSYYTLAALGPEVQKYLWWKRYITSLQLVQFVIGFVHLANAIRIGCNYVAWIKYLAFFYDVGYLVLFGIFYRNTYVVNKTQKSEKKAITDNFSNGNDSSNNNIRKRTFASIAASS